MKNMVNESIESTAAAVGSMLKHSWSISGTEYQSVAGLVEMLLSKIQAVLLESNIIGLFTFLATIVAGFGIDKISRRKMSKTR